MSYLTHTAIVLLPVIYRLLYGLPDSYSYCTVPCFIQASIWVMGLILLLYCSLLYTGFYMSYLNHTAIVLFPVLYRLLYELPDSYSHCTVPFYIQASVWVTWLILLLYCSLLYTGFYMSYLTHTAIIVLFPVIYRFLHELPDSYSYCTVPCYIQASIWVTRLIQLLYCSLLYTGFYMGYLTHTAIVLFPVLYRLLYELCDSYCYCTVPCYIQASIWVTWLIQLLYCSLFYTGFYMSYVTHTAIVLFLVIYRLLYELPDSYSYNCTVPCYIQVSTWVTWLIQLLYCSLLYTGFYMSYPTHTAIVLFPVIYRLLYGLPDSYSYCTVPCFIQASIWVMWLILLLYCSLLYNSYRSLYKTGNSTIAVWVR